MKKTILLLLGILMLSSLAYSQTIDEKWVKDNYIKREVMIPMRDGVKLYTAVYQPADSSRHHPILMYRTPYGCNPYGKDFNGDLWYSLSSFAQKGYIIVYQDVRGRRMSEGTFVDVRPIHSELSSTADDVSDMYDTVDWLLKHTVNNAKVGVTGCSYLGYYALTSAICNHPAIKAVCPQAPIGDWFMGDDTHHNGALMLTDAFSFLSHFERPRTKPSPADYPYRNYYSEDEYSFFLKAGTVKNLTRMLGDSVRFWNDITNHPNYDEWWKERCPFRLYHKINAAVLVVGGLFDAEDAYGTWQSYKTLKKRNADKPLYLLIGPWQHGGWNWSRGDCLGNVRFGNANHSQRFIDIQQQFFDYYLLGEGEFDNTPKATVFFTGENRWKTFSNWPASNSVPTAFYLKKGGQLSATRPSEKSSYTTYTSNPDKPVPFTATISHGRPSEYMTEDQRFASTRPDVLTFQTEPLKENVTLGGELEADLRVALSTTDADFIIKLIDVFPDDFKYDKKVDGAGNGNKYLMGGYQMLVRGDVMRGRYRKGFEHPVPFIPNKIDNVSFKLSDVAHTFLKGHRIMVQIQSTWFPLVDRNPQQMVDIYHCDKKDFISSVIKIYHQADNASRLILPVLK